MEIFDGLEVIISVLGEFLYDKAFNKKISIKKRLPYIISYIIISISVMSLLTYLSINLIIEKNIIFSAVTIIVTILFLILLVSPFITKRKK